MPLIISIEADEKTENQVRHLNICFYGRTYINLLTSMKSQHVSPNAGASRSPTISPGDAPEQAVALGGLDGAADPRPRQDPGEEPRFIKLNAGQTRIRLRGRSLELAGYLYVGARFTLHRIGAPANTDLRVNSLYLRTHFSELGNEVYYRVEMNAIYLCRDACELGFIGWGAHDLLPHPKAPSLTANDYINILKLGDTVFKKWILFVWYSDDDHIWAVNPQMEGKVYSVQECLDIFKAPDQVRREVTGFGRRVWTVGQPVPRCYLAKDLPIKFVVSKIREVMRRRVENCDVEV